MSGLKKKEVAMSTRSRPVKTLLTLLPVLLLLAAIAIGVTLTQQHHSAHAAESCGTVIGRVNPSTDGYANLEITIATGYGPEEYVSADASGTWYNTSTGYSSGQWHTSGGDGDVFGTDYTYVGHGEVSYEGTVHYTTEDLTPCTKSIVAAAYV